MKRIKLLLTVLYTLSLTLVPGLMLASAAHATGTGGLNCGAELEFGGTCTTQETDGTDGVNKIVNLVITIFSWLVGVVSVVMIIVGGFKYVTSGGESAGVTSAKNTILYAIVGLIIVAVAQIIVHFVLGNVNNAAGTS